jgi:hypothetical protein
MKKNYELHNNTSDQQRAARDELSFLFQNRPMSDEHLLTNFGLFFRASALAKILFLHEAYRKIRDIPGDIYVFGVWLGQDLAVFESMRAIIEPYNASRKLVGFDTFSGYVGVAENDRRSDVIKEEGYSTNSAYMTYLERLLAYHRKENTMGHAVSHFLVQGDVVDTVPKFIRENPESMVALAYFDMALYEPTIAALESLTGRLMPGSVIVLDEFNDPRYPGETIAFREWAKHHSYSISRSEVLPDRTFITVRN